MFTSYSTGFYSFSQNYTVWCEYTFPSTFTLSVGLKTLNINLMCFDGKKQPFEKNTREGTEIVITKRCQKC